MILPWGIPRWLCWLLSRHALAHKWGRYDIDDHGQRCACGQHWTSLAEGVCYVGKKRAGHLLDGRTWDEMPEVRR